MQAEEFVNPKSMMTPGVVAAMVATVAGSLFATFGVALPFSIVVLSFLFGAIVFHSKEFSDPAMKTGPKLLFYLLNSLIIFGMATGTHAVLDRGAARQTTGLSLISEAHAQDVTASSGVLQQSRPLFHDWTRQPPAAPAADTGIIQVRAHQRGGALRKWASESGLWVPDYKLYIQIDKAKLPSGDIKRITWKLPPQEFENHTVAMRGAKSPLEVDAWKPFELTAEIELASGQKIVAEKLVAFGAR